MRISSLRLCHIHGLKGSIRLNTALAFTLGGSEFWVNSRLHLLLTTWFCSQTFHKIKKSSKHIFKFWAFLRVALALIFKASYGRKITLSSPFFFSEDTPFVDGSLDTNANNDCLTAILHPRGVSTDLYLMMGINWKVASYVGLHGTVTGRMALWAVMGVPAPGAPVLPTPLLHISLNSEVFESR